jgi:hypothetical protein
MSSAWGAVGRTHAAVGSGGLVKRPTEAWRKLGDFQKAGKLEAFLAKRRKKNAAKDHRYIPSRRRSAVTDA